jgi:hypothetical protein
MQWTNELQCVPTKTPAFFPVKDHIFDGFIIGPTELQADTPARNFNMNPAQPGPAPHSQLTQFAGDYCQSLVVQR